jgi:isoaspartyl peptidase/L-asparaginase-like protein (Ntn-hydrolase superfamily)
MMENQVEIAVLQTKVDALIEKQKELTARVRANEKVVAAVTLLGTVVLAVIGAGYFAPKADAHTFPTAGEWINDMREWKSEQDRVSIDEMLNNALGDFYWEDPDGSNDPTEQEELLQLSSDGD